MKLKFISCVIFILFSILFFHYLVSPTVVIKVCTNAPEEKIILEYKDDENFLKRISSFTLGDGNTRFYVPLKKLKFFKLFISSPHKIETVVVKANKRQ